MAGGSGTRLWPISRDTMPKQFTPLLEDGQSTFQATVRRVSGRVFDAPIIITNNDFRFICAEQLQNCQVEARSFSSLAGGTPHPPSPWER